MYAVRQLSGPKPKPGAHFETGLVFPVYNRSKYLRRSLASLQASDLRGTLILAVDDASDDPAVLEMLQNLSLSEQPVFLMQRQFRLGFGVAHNLRSAFDFLQKHFDCRYFAVLDSDTVMRPGWLRCMTQMHERLERERPIFFLTGFNAFAHKIKKSFADYRIKASIGGVNLLFRSELYEPILRRCLQFQDTWDWEMVRACRRRGVFLICTRPSVVQHIGKRGAWSQGALLHDWALDYRFHKPEAVIQTLVFFMHLLHRISRRIEIILSKSWRKS